MPKAQLVKVTSKFSAADVKVHGVVFSKDMAGATAAITAAVRSIGNVQKCLQHAAIVAIGHVNLHGDIGVANKCLSMLQKAAGIKGVKLQAWVTYCEQYGALSYNKDAKVFAHRKDADVLREPADLMLALHAAPWQDSIAEKPVETIHDCMKDVTALIKKLEALAALDCKLESEFVLEGLKQLRDYVPEVIGQKAAD